MRTENSSFKPREARNQSLAGGSASLPLSPNVRIEIEHWSGRCLIQSKEQTICSSLPIREAIAVGWPFNRYSNGRCQLQALVRRRYILRENCTRKPTNRAVTFPFNSITAHRPATSGVSVQLLARGS
jgi:hypothetical protein